MRKAKFPRVASRTQPKPPPAIKLPPLLCGIYDRDGELVRVADMPDPRAGFCTEFNHRREAHGFEARPLDSDVTITPRRRKAVLHG